MYCPSYNPMSCYPNCASNPPSQVSCDVSKLASFAVYGGGGCCPPCPPPYCCIPQCMPKNCCPPPKCCPPPSCGPVIRKCPPLPPCAPTCCIREPEPKCKDMPSQRLRNVDVLEELCYYAPGGDPNGPMDCYSVDACGNVEKLCEGCDPCCPCNPPPPQPVKYSRRQRFTFNEPGGNSQSCGNDPWPFDGNCAGDASCGRGCGKNKCKPKKPAQDGSILGALVNACCESRNPNGEGCNSNSNRKYTYCPEEEIDCSEMLPGETGVYYFDRVRKVFIPECELPKPPTIIEKQVKVPDVEEYELLEDISCEPGGGAGGGGGGAGGGGGGAGGRVGTDTQPQTQIQPVVQPIFMPSNPPFAPPNNPGPPPGNPTNPPPCSPCQPSCSSQRAPPACMPPCNPCSSCMPPCNPCNPCMPQFNPCNPCMPCGPMMNPLMNMCGGVLPMVIPMCNQQPMMPPPPPFPFPPPFMMNMNKKKKKKCRSSYDSSSYPTNTYDDSTSKGK